jgi:hypothetical protein
VPIGGADGRKTRVAFPGATSGVQPTQQLKDVLTKLLAKVTVNEGVDTAVG